MNVNDNIQVVIDIATCYPSIKRVGIFGSYSRNEQSSNSDIDILYDYDENMIDDTIKCLGDMLRAIEIKVDFVAYDDLLDSKDYDFRENVLNDVIWIYER